MDFKQLAQTIVVAATLLIAQPIQAETFYFHNDHLGTPQALTDDSGTVVWQGNYSPFGEVNETTDTVEQNIRFPGQYFEEETGLHYNYFRDYDPGTGRYIESDPIGLQGGINTFGYVNGRPISRVDPRGLAGFIGGDFLLPLYGGVAGGGGIVQVSCKDECGEEQKFRFKKICVGFSPTFSAQIIGGGVSNMDGVKCKPETYSGYFLEGSSTAPFGLGGGVDIGLTSEDVNGFPVPNGFSGTNEAGAGGGTPGNSVALCYYIPI